MERDGERKNKHFANVGEVFVGVQLDVIEASRADNVNVFVFIIQPAFCNQSLHFVAVNEILELLNDEFSLLGRCHCIPVND